MRTELSIVKGLLGASALAVLLALAGCGGPSPDTSPRAATKNAFSELGKEIDNLELVAAEGSPVRWRDLDGRPRALFFGFTRCPVICPLTVWQLNDAMDRMGADAKDLEIHFVSLDPERDTPQVISEYFSGFKGRVRPFTGTTEAVAKAARAFEVTYQKSPLDNGDYTIDHSTLVYFLDAQGNVVDAVAHDSASEVMQARLRALVAQK